MSLIIKFEFYWWIMSLFIGADVDDGVGIKSGSYINITYPHIK